MTDLKRAREEPSDWIMTMEEAQAWKRIAEDRQEGMELLSGRIGELEAELARLREALREIADAPYLEDAEDIQAIARNALKGDQ